MERYSLVLYEREAGTGLSFEDVKSLLNLISSDQCYLNIEIDSNGFGSSAMGFIDIRFADELRYDYKESGLSDFISNILEDINNESEDHIYDFNGHKIWMSR